MVPFDSHGTVIEDHSISIKPLRPHWIPFHANVSFDYKVNSLWKECQYLWFLFQLVSFCNHCFLWFPMEMLLMIIPYPLFFKAPLNLIPYQFSFDYKVNSMWKECQYLRFLCQLVSIWYQCFLLCPMELLLKSFHSNCFLTAHWIHFISMFLLITTWTQFEKSTMSLFLMLNYNILWLS